MGSLRSDTMYFLYNNDIETSRTRPSSKCVRKRFWGVAVHDADIRQLIIKTLIGCTHDRTRNNFKMKRCRTSAQGLFWHGRIGGQMESSGRAKGVASSRMRSRSAQRNTDRIGQLQEAVAVAAAGSLTIYMINAPCS